MDAERTQPAGAALGIARGVMKLVPADPAWAGLAREEIVRLTRCIVAAGLPVPTFAHVGSTSVPGLPAKPIIDLMAGHDDDSRAADYLAVLAAAGYAHRGTPNDPATHVLARGPASARTHYLHLTPLGGTSWHEHLAFRDRLRTDPGRAADYARLKHALAAAHPEDRAAYTRGKTRFIAETLRATAGIAVGNPVPPRQENRA